MRADADGQGAAGLRAGFVQDLFRLEGRSAVIVGGKGVLAETIAATLADLGCDIALASRHEADCADTAGRIAAQFGRRAIGRCCDISKEEDVERLMAEVQGEFGRVDVLVNNAGTSWWGPPEDIPLSGWRKVVDVNLTGTFLSCRHAARIMKQQHGGCIVNIASVGAFLSYTPDVGQVVPYTTSKAAVVHLTRDLAAQWAGHGIRVNAIAPDNMESGMTATLTEEARRLVASRILLGRLAKPVEIAGTVALLVSPAGSFITGQTIILDGGHTLP